MRFRFFVAFCLGLCTLMPSSIVHAQTARTPDPYGQITIFGGAGLAYYLGDISAKLGADSMGLGPAFSLGATYRVTERLSARGEFRVYNFKGDSYTTSEPNKNLSFKTTNPDLRLSIQADLFPYSSQPLINPYAFAGVGITYLNPKAEWGGAVYSLPPLETETNKYWRLPLVLTGGIGAMVRITPNWSAGLEVNGNYLFSDYLDDVSTVYPDYQNLKSTNSYDLAYRGTNFQPGNPRGNPKTNDSYFTLGVRVAYALPNPRYAKERKITQCP